MLRVYIRFLSVYSLYENDLKSTEIGLHERTFGDCPTALLRCVPTSSKILYFKVISSHKISIHKFRLLVYIKMFLLNIIFNTVNSTWRCNVSSVP